MLIDRIPIASSQNSLASLALTSKQFLSPARMRLYSRPFINAPLFTWIKAVALAHTLRTGNLGRHVNSLEGIVSCMFNLDKTTALSTPLPYQIRGYTKAFSWYIAVLQACLHLVEVDIYFKNQNQLKKIETSLESATSTLRIANFVDDDGDRVRQEDRMTSGCVKGALKRNPFKNVESIKLESIEYLHSTRLDHPLVSLHLKSTRQYGTSLNAFQLTNLSRFHTLRIGSGGSSSGITSLITSLAPALQHLEILHSQPLTQCRPHLTTYDQRDYAIIFYRDLQPLVNLVSFSATYARKPWLPIFETIQKSSLSLEIIDLHGSHWMTSDDYDLRYAEPEERYGTACPEKELKELLLGFKNLKKVDLGTLPTTDRGAYKLMETELRDKGVAVEWESCRDSWWCSVCGSFHW